MVELIIDSIRVNVLSFQRVVILRVKDSDKYLPIWIGASEADAIALKLQDIQVARPMTHDLLRSALATVGATVSRIVVSDLSDDTYYAKIVIQHNGSTVELDSRPSDAIALAVRTQAPIYAADAVVEQAGIEMDLESGKTLVDPKARHEIVHKQIGEEELKGLSAYREFVMSLDHLDDIGQQQPPAASPESEQ
jgi:bifunctional DNase/RNase